MFFWNTKQLATIIKQEGLSEHIRMNYYLATSIFSALSIYMTVLIPRNNTYAVLVEAASILLILIFGIKITFSSNKGKDGSDYVGRMIALSFPLLIKALVIGLVFGVIIGIYSGYTGNKNVNDWPITISTIAIQAWYFWRLNLHIKFINS